MKIEELKLYGKYKSMEFPDKELIYIGIDNANEYWFLFKEKNNSVLLSDLENYGFNPNKIINDLNLETHTNKFGFKYIKGYVDCFYSKKHAEKYLKPFLKDKLNNIINR
jgi:hypothetical protein